MKIGTSVFKGRIPRLASRLLPPENSGDTCVNCKLYTGDLEPFTEPSIKDTLDPAGVAGPNNLKVGTNPAKNIYSLQKDPVVALSRDFLRWQDEVSVARPPLSGDDKETLIYTSARDNEADGPTPALPKITNITKATVNDPANGRLQNQYPHSWNLLGVPEPTVAPTVAMLKSSPQTFTYTKFDSHVANIVSTGGYQSFITRPADQTIRYDIDFTFNTSANIFEWVNANTTYWGIKKSVNQQNSIFNSYRFEFTPIKDQALQEVTHGFHFKVGANDIGGGITVVVEQYSEEGRWVTQDSSLPVHRITVRTDQKNELTNSVNVTLPNVDKFVPLAEPIVQLASHQKYLVTIDTIKLVTGFIKVDVRFESIGGPGTLVTISKTVPQSAVLGNVVAFMTRMGLNTTTTPKESVNLYVAEHYNSEPVDSLSTFTSYVYTNVNNDGFESAPSPASEIVYSHPDLTVAVGMPVVNAGDTTSTSCRPNIPLDEYGLSTSGTKYTRFVYRSASTETGETQFLFVNQVLNGGVSLSDKKKNSELGEPLETTDWELPPCDGHSVVSLPNGITVMASKNELCPSVVDRPHAYPLDFRLSTDFPIVGLAAIDTTIVVLTEANPYIVVGNTPDSLSMAKLELNQGCVSRESIQLLKGYGVVYASPDGLCAIDGASVQIITEQYYTRDQWQNLNPETMVSFVHDDRYFCFHDGNSTVAGFVFDPKPTGFGVVDLSFTAFNPLYQRISGGYTDPLTDSLYIVPSGQPSVLQWEGGFNSMQYIWDSKSHELPFPIAFTMASVKYTTSGQDPGGSTFNLFVTNPVNGKTDTQSTKTIPVGVSRDLIFRISPRAVNRATYRITGHDRVREVQVVEDESELT